jgi:site-specific recombinase XerD
VDIGRGDTIVLKVVGNRKPGVLVPVCEALADHHSLVDGYIKSQRARGLAATTITKEEAFLTSWFEIHGPEGRPLFVWEAMDDLRGRKNIIDYRDVLVEGELQTETIRGYLGILRRFFEFILLQPAIFTTDRGILIQDKYGVRLGQPVSEFDMPRYIWDGERLGVPLDPERLYEFYRILRQEYLNTQSWLPLRQRNYAMAVLAGESGLRIDELLHLEVEKDLFFTSKKLQTRHGKGAKGSGKRCRVTLFTPLARDTVTYYLKTRRRYWRVDDTGYLFLSKSGSRLTYNAVQPALKSMIDASRRAGFPVMDHLTWHWFRRFFATRFVERFPGKLSALIELLGHMSPNTVHRYIRHSEAWMDRQIQEALEGAERWPSTGT